MYCNLVLLGNQASISHPIPRNKRCSLWRTLSWILLSLHIIHIPIIRNIKIIFNNLYMVLFLKLIFRMFSLSSWTNLSYLSKLSRTPAVKTQKQTSPTNITNRTHLVIAAEQHTHTSCGYLSSRHYCVMFSSAINQKARYFCLFWSTVC